MTTPADYSITEELQVDISSVAPTVEQVSPNIIYDVVVNNIGFFSGITPETPYRRETAQYRKDQQDNSAEPGEQSLTGWWLRSQSSFHLGCGIKFYEPSQDEKLRFRFSDSVNVDVWTQGEVSLLPEMLASTTEIAGSGATYMQTIQSGGTNAVLVWDGNNVYKVDASGNKTTFIASTQIYGICNDGVYAYWCQNNSGVAKFYKKLLSTDSSTAGTQFHYQLTEAASIGIMEWAKERVIACVNNKVYELNPNAGTASGGTNDPIKVYENRSSAIIYTSITASGSDIYISAYNGLNSFILRLVLDTDGAIVPTLDGAVVAAEMPRGELIYSIRYYLGYLVVGTSFGVRVAQVLDGGDIVYGPLFLKTEQPVYGFACDDSYVWCASGVSGTAGLTRVDLSTQIDTLVFPWANDRSIPTLTGTETTGVAFIGSTDKLAFSVALENVFYEGNDLCETGYITTGFIRYNTLEKKIFKFISERASYKGNSSLKISVINSNEVNNDIIIKLGLSAGTDVTVPGEPSEFVKFKFTLTRNPDTGDEDEGTVLYGYQVKSLPATPRQRLIQYPLYCFDTEMDRFNNRIGYDGQAVERLGSIEALESLGDAVTVQDNRSGEVYTGLIEEVAYTAMTPPDKRFSGNGGMLQVTVRKI